MSTKLSDQNRLVALAYLHQGKTPREVEKLMPDVSYAQALRLKKELEEAKDQGSLRDIFSLPESALEVLMEKTKEHLAEAANELTGDLLPLEEALDDISDRVKASKLLEVELSNAAIALVRRMKVKATTTENADTMLLLAESIAKLQIAFFKSTNINVANFPPSDGSRSGFEAMLKS